MQRPTHQRRTNRKSSKWPLPTLALAIVLIAFGSLALGSTIFATAKNAQLAAAAASGSGQCEQKYKQCMSDPKQTNKQKCETDWKICVGKKCVAKDTATVDTCPKDPDCEMSCTESATSQKGLLSCCKGGPKHNNSCQKEIDGKCNPAKQMPSNSGLEQLPTQSGQQMPPIPQANGPEQLPQQSEEPTRNWPECQAFGTCVEQAPSEPAPQPTQNKSWWDNMQQYLGISPASAPSPDTRADNTSPGTPQSSFCCNSYSGSSNDQVQLEQDIGLLQPSEDALRQQNPLSPEQPIYSYPESTFSAQDTLQNAPAANTCHFHFLQWCLW